MVWVTPEPIPVTWRQVNLGATPQLRALFAEIAPPSAAGQPVPSFPLEGDILLRTRPTGQVAWRAQAAPFNTDPGFPLTLSDIQGAIAGTEQHTDPAGVVTGDATGLLDPRHTWVRWTYFRDQSGGNQIQDVVISQHGEWAAYAIGWPRGDLVYDDPVTDWATKVLEPYLASQGLAGRLYEVDPASAGITTQPPWLLYLAQFPNGFQSSTMDDPYTVDGAIGLYRLALADITVSGAQITHTANPSPATVAAGRDRIAEFTPTRDPTGQWLAWGMPLTSAAQITGWQDDVGGRTIIPLLAVHNVLTGGGGWGWRTTNIGVPGEFTQEKRLGVDCTPVIQYWWQPPNWRLLGGAPRLRQTQRDDLRHSQLTSRQRSIRQTAYL